MRNCAAWLPGGRDNWAANLVPTVPHARFLFVDGESRSLCGDWNDERGCNHPCPMVDMHLCDALVPVRPVNLLEQNVPGARSVTVTMSVCGSREHTRATHLQTQDCFISKSFPGISQGHLFDARVPRDRGSTATTVWLHFPAGDPPAKRARKE